MMELTVADELAFDALPEETRRLCEKIIADRAVEGYDDWDLEAAEERGYRRGLAEGQRLAPKQEPGKDAAVAE